LEQIEDNRDVNDLVEEAVEIGEATPREKVQKGAEEVETRAAV
jgi:hypothetical protein